MTVILVVAGSLSFASRVKIVLTVSCTFSGHAVYELTRFQKLTFTKAGGYVHLYANAYVDMYMEVCPWTYFFVSLIYE